MAVTGNQIDLMQRMYSADVMEELQQRMSLLRAHVEIEAVTNGDSIRFQKFGAQNSAAEQTVRLQDRTYGDYTAERRIIMPVPIETAPIGIDRFDELRFITSPRSEIVKAQAMNLGRYIDDLIIQSFGGTALTEIDGVATNETLSSAQKVVFNDTAYTAIASPATTLTQGKLQHAIQILRAGYVDVRLEDCTVFLNSNQAACLLAQLQLIGQARTDFMGRPVLMDAPGIDPSLEGYLGLHFVITERIPQDASSHDLVYVVAKSACKLAVWQDVQTTIFTDFRKKLDPLAIVSNMVVGAGRMYQEKLVQIACTTS